MHDALLVKPVRVTPTQAQADAVHPGIPIAEPLFQTPTRIDDVVLVVVVVVVVVLVVVDDVVVGFGGVVVVTGGVVDVVEPGFRLVVEVRDVVVDVEERDVVADVELGDASADAGTGRSVTGGAIAPVAGSAAVPPVVEVSLTDPGTVGVGVRGAGAATTFQAGSLVAVRPASCHQPTPRASRSTNPPTSNAGRALRAAR